MAHLCRHCKIESVSEHTYTHKHAFMLTNTHVYIIHIVAHAHTCWFPQGAKAAKLNGGVLNNHTQASLLDQYKCIHTYTYTHIHTDWFRQGAKVQSSTAAH